MKRYKLYCDYSSINGRWSVELKSRSTLLWVFEFWITEMAISLTNLHWTRSENVKRWLRELENVELYVNGKKEPIPVNI